MVACATPVLSSEMFKTRLFSAYDELPVIAGVERLQSALCAAHASYLQALPSGAHHGGPAVDLSLYHPDGARYVPPLCVATAAAHRRSCCMHVNIELEHKARTSPMLLALVDTGADITVLDARCFPEAAWCPSQLRCRVANGAQQPVVGVLHNVTLRFATRGQVRTVCVPEVFGFSQLSSQLIIGFDALKAAHMIFEAAPGERPVLSLTDQDGCRFSVHDAGPLLDLVDVSALEREWAGAATPQTLHAVHIQALHGAMPPVPPVAVPDDPPEVALPSEGPTYDKVAAAAAELDPAIAAMLHRHCAAFPDRIPFGQERSEEQTVHLRVKPDALPKAAKPIPLGPYQTQVLHDNLEKLLQEGVIEPSASPYAAPVFFVPKKDAPAGSPQLRMVIDYRYLNSQSYHFDVGGPTVADCLSKLAGMTLFSTLDLAAAFHQMPLSKADRHYSAFITALGKYQFRTATFGMRIAPSMINMIMSTALSGLATPAHKSVSRIDLGGDAAIIYYVDDILIAARTRTAHDKALEALLARLVEHRLYAQPHKCRFLQSQVVFLGYLVGEAGLSIEPRKLEALRAMRESPPTTIKQMQRFLAQLQYNRAFIPRLAVVTASLREVTKLRQWPRSGLTEMQLQAYHDVVDALLAAAPLAHFDFACTDTVLETDACDVGAGAVLLQHGRVVSYFSQHFSGPQLAYHTGCQEFLAIVLALRHFKLWLKHHNFELRTDHQKLTLYDTKRNLTKMEQRWLLFLSEFDFRWQFLKGDDNAIADYLSRYAHPQLALAVDAHARRAPLRDATGQAILPRVSALPLPLALPLGRQDSVVPPQGVPPVSLHELNTRLTLFFIQEYASCADFARVAAHLASQPHSVFFMQNGLIYVKRTRQLCVPRSCRLELLHWSHSSPLGGHFGIRKTLARLDRYHWPAKAKDVRTHVNACERCARVKVPPVQPPGPPHPLPTPTARFAEVAVDFLFLPADKSQPQLYTKPPDMVLVIQDRFTKLARFVPVSRSLTVDQLIYVFLREWVRSHGVPTHISSDSDTKFAAEKWQSFVALLHVAHRFSSPYHQSANGQAERLVRTVKEYLTAFASSHKLVLSDPVVDPGAAASAVPPRPHYPLQPTSDFAWLTDAYATPQLRAKAWLHHLIAFEMAYNSAPHSVTGVPPNVLAYGQDFPVPAWLSDVTLAPPKPPKLDALGESLQQSFVAARERLEQNRARMLIQLEAKHSGVIYKVGDFVLVNQHALRGNTAIDTISPRFEGPFSVLEVRDGSYRLDMSPYKSARNHYWVNGKYLLIAPPALRFSAGTLQKRGRPSEQTTKAARAFAVPLPRPAPPVLAAVALHPRAKPLNVHFAALCGCYISGVRDVRRLSDPERAFSPSPDAQPRTLVLHTEWSDAHARPLGTVWLTPAALSTIPLHARVEALPLARSRLLTAAKKDSQPFDAAAPDPLDILVSRDLTIVSLSSDY